MHRQNSNKKIITNASELLDKTELHHSEMALADNAIEQFPVRVPESWVSRIHKNDKNDPLLKQVLPFTEEDQIHKDFTVDPVADSHSEIIPGLLHKYHGRVLLVLTGACPIHCRYCFRRHYPYNKSSVKASDLKQAMEYIENHRDIHEVIYSGGDPLSLSDQKLAEITQRISMFKHIKRLRIHSRIPIVTPDRITDGTLEWMESTHLKIIMIVHVNHAQELNEDVKNTIIKMKKCGIEIMNQSVLLKEINDSPEILIELSETLFEYGILPYYLHQLDKVQGAAHFLVPDETAIQLHQHLRDALPGYLVPKLVREIAGKKSKTPIF